MRQTQLFTKTRREAPKDEQARNAMLLIRAGFIHKEMAGVYAFLPLGLRVLEKVKAIVRDEMNKLGAEELIMTSLQRKELWEQTDRWDSKKVDVWFKSELAAGGEVGFGWSHEEPIGNMLRDHIASYKDLPTVVYQFQTKLRNELRAKSGIMRGREFVMKDAYSFCADEAQHEKIYEEMKYAYLRVFERVGLGADTYVTFASGGAFTQWSHEFQTVCDAGEDVCQIAHEKHVAVNEEVANDDALKTLGVTRDELVTTKTAEVGNIFNFGREKAKGLDLLFADAAGERIPVWMGSYGIGITRLIGVVVEKYADEKGMVWPRSLAPFDVHLVALGTDPAVTAHAVELYTTLTRGGIEVLYDDRDVRAGEKFADSDLIGIPTRVVVSAKALERGTYEVVDRTTMTTQLMSEAELRRMLSQ